LSPLGGFCLQEQEKDGAGFVAGEPAEPASAAVLVILRFVLLGCFTPSRYHYQHFLRPSSRVLL
jgi:hypothetical protein